MRRGLPEGELLIVGQIGENRPGLQPLVIGGTDSLGRCPRLV